MTTILFAVSVLAFLIFVGSLVARHSLEDPEDKRQTGLIARISIVVFICCFFLSMIIIVPAGYRGVLLKFGEVQGVENEGIHFIVPYINHVELMEVRTVKEEDQASAASKDLQTVMATIALNFHVDPSRVGDLYRNVGKDYAQRVIDPAVQESIKQVTAQYTAEELIKKRAQVKAEVEQEITARLANYWLIVETMGVSITDFQFSEAFNQAIEQKQVAQQETEKQKYILQKAELEKETAITKAEGEAKAVQIKASALKAQGGSKALAREWIEKWNGTLPVYMGGGGSVIIDLKNLMADNTAG